MTTVPRLRLRFLTPGLVAFGILASGLFAAGHSSGVSREQAGPVVSRLVSTPSDAVNNAGTPASTLLAQASSTPQPASRPASTGNTANNSSTKPNSATNSNSPAKPSAKSLTPVTRTPTSSTTGDKNLRTREQVDALINEQGRKPPEWFDKTPLQYPQTLNLSWPEKPEGGWNNQKNVGQYVWDIINPNPGKWKEGVRLMHHLLVLNQNSVDTRTRVMEELGRMYFNLHEDYARAAFWWRQSGAEKPAHYSSLTIHLAECYYRLGNREMAADLLRKADTKYDSIKLWGELGDLNMALQLAEEFVKEGYSADTSYLYAGDACRLAGKYPQAIEYYQKVLDIPSTHPRIERNRRRAKSNLEAVKLFELSDVRKVPDGVYTKSAIGYEGAVQVEVTVRSARITGVRVTQHKEKQFYSALSDTPAKIIAKQSVKGVDATSGATLTSEAIINATAKALSDAAKP